MPYITREARDELNFRAPLTPGELNYRITALLRDEQYARAASEVYGYIERSPIQSYELYNSVIGVLECARREHIRRGWGREQAHRLESLIAELYRDVVAPYEDAKIIENGDI